MTFGEAVERMKGGTRMRRAGWNGKDMWVGFCRGCWWGTEAVTLEDFLVMRTAQATFVPWLASQSDVLATDWDVAR